MIAQPLPQVLVSSFVATLSISTPLFYQQSFSSNTLGGRVDSRPYCSLIRKILKFKIEKLWEYWTKSCPPGIINLDPTHLDLWNPNYQSFIPYLRIKSLIFGIFCSKIKVFGQNSTPAQFWGCFRSILYHFSSKIVKKNS